jgi:mannose-6-phosphate isomerase-like protein (cupin superfamily)
VRIFDWDFATCETGPIAGGECEDLDYTLLHWLTGGGVEEHVNDEVDVMMIVLQGNGVVVVEGVAQPVTSGKALVLPKGSRRQIRSSSDDFRYLNVHKRRRRLMPDMKRQASV